MKKIAEKNIIMIYSLLFVAVIAACFFSFWRTGKLPIYGIDGLGQYYPVFLYTGKTIREFFSHLFESGAFRFYDLSVGMGEDIFGTLNYYGFGDPVNLITVFATKGNGPYLFAFSYYLRLYLGGLAFVLYCMRFNLSKPAVAAGAVSYVFFGYGLYASGMYIEFASMLYVFPLLLTGCERVLHGEKGRWILFVSAWYLGLCGFYFTYMCALFLVVYCLVRSFFISGKADIEGMLTGCLGCAALFVLGLACSAPVLFPSVFAFLSSARSSSLGIGQLFVLGNYIPSLSRRFVSDANIMNAMRNYPVLIAAASTFFLAKDKRIIQLRIATVTLLVLLYVPITAIVFNGFSNPRDRWVFEAQFVLCAAFAVAIDKVKEQGCGRIYNAALILAVCNIIISFWGRYSALGDDEKQLYVNAATAVAETSSPVSTAAVIENDSDLFRVCGEFVSEVNSRPVNDGMNAGYYGTHYWFSVVNENTQAFVDEATGRSNDWRSFGLGSDNRYHTAAAVKYYVSKTGSAPDGFVPAGDIEYNGESRKLYVNENFRGFACIKDGEDSENDAAVIGSCSGCTYDGNDFSCTADDDAKNAIVVTAFPYAKGWSAKIGGRQAATLNSSGFLAIFADDLHKDDIITLHYTSPGFMPGMIVALISLLLFIAVCMFRGFSERRKTSREKAVADQ